ncbi:unnamed protein product [Cylicocyclus nassatus]|uniref:Secreted protein n=1 Tax=Cylicocyclus nassatus TaxID=53992 RepID=A0AA36GL88_CYLNA|nr:unnamed protein product [Cylicocyclus nassatus]
MLALRYFVMFMLATATYAMSRQTLNRLMINYIQSITRKSNISGPSKRSYWPSQYTQKEPLTHVQHTIE